MRSGHIHRRPLTRPSREDADASFRPLTRRGWIQRALALIGIAPVALTACASAATERPLSRRRPDTALSDVEVEDMLAFGEMIVAGRPLDRTERNDLSEYIQHRTSEDPRMLARYRAALTTLARLTGTRFSALDLAARRDLIVRERLESIPPRPEGDLWRVIPDLVLGYYASAAGWNAVGYRTFPGRCGDLTRYTRREP